MLIPERDNENNIYTPISPFASNVVPEGVLYKRVHGVSELVPAGATVNIDFVLPYAVSKFVGAEIVNTSIGDCIDMGVFDTATNAYSKLDVAQYGASVLLNRFGFSVFVGDGTYTNISNYAASLYAGMTCRCVYTNSGTVDKVIGINYDLHEVIPHVVEEL